MRKRFEQQLRVGQVAIEDVKITLKSRDAAVDLLAALQAIFANSEYNNKIFNVLESSILKGKHKTGRTGMDLWHIFVLAQFRLCKNMSYDGLHYQANNDKLLRSIMGVERESGYEQIEFEYQNIYDNVKLLDDETVRQLNEIILSFGHDIFKKKGTEALRLKTDSFVVESNVHFPTDYNLIWDCARKSTGVVLKLIKKYGQINGWRKIKDWRHEIKGLMREFGKTNSSGGKNKEIRVQTAAINYLNKVNNLVNKFEKEIPLFPIFDEMDLALLCTLDKYIDLLKKVIDLFHRRVINGEQIPHDEKIFSIFEEYTELIKKGKLFPNVELGKKLSITTDQFNLILDYQVMENEQDRDIVIPLADRILNKYKINSWSFDKGFWNKENKALLQTEIPNVIMPKLGKKNQEEQEMERARSYKKLKNKHSAIESNINELEHRGLDRCPDRGYRNFKSYIGLGVCAYNLKKIGKVILEESRNKIKASAGLKRAA